MITASDKQRKAAGTKLKQLVEEYGEWKVRKALEYLSPKGRVGDGLGPVYEGLKHGWVESKIREDGYQKNLAEDRKNYPKHKRTQPDYQEADENDATRTNEERNRQLQQLALAE